jgi:uncharacterized repeat protein (TIGR02543 family)
MKIRVLFVTLALILVVLISGCKKNDYQATVGVCPIVVSTIPANGAVGVPLNQVISATFNETMNAATITSSSFTITDFTKSAELKVAVVVTGTISYSGMTATFTPSSPLTPSTTYTGRVTTAVRDTRGNALQTDYVWTFATDLPPTVASDPANNATGVLLNKVIVATFSVPMDSLTLKTPATNFTMKQGTTTVPGKFTYASKTASFTPTTNLAPFTVYTGTISSGVKNTLGTSMAADYVWSFTTIPQLTLSAMPVLGGTTTGAGVFAQGSSVTVVATANTGYTFFNWTDGATVVSTAASYQFAMAGNKTLVANFTPRFVVTVLSNPILGGVTSGGGTFNTGTSVTVTAVPNAGFTFTNWTEGVNVVSSTASYQFTLTANRSLVANYAAIPYTIAVSSNPLLGGTTTGSGTFNSGASVTVTAAPNAGFTFTNWTEGVNIVSPTATYQFTIAGNRTLVANYTAIPYTVAVSSLPLLGGITTGGGTFNSGASVTVTAAPNAGFTFTNWTEGTNIVSTNANYLFTIAGNRTLVANFNAIPYTVAVSSNPILGGTTSGGGIFNSGSLVTVNAVPNVGYTFTNWTEGLVVVSTLANYQFTITGNRILVANYIPITYTVAVSSNPLIGGTTTGGGTFNVGASVTVSAVPNAGYTFTNWTEGLVVASTNANYLFTLAGNRTLVANYALIPYFNVAVSSSPLAGGTSTGGGSFATGASVTIAAVPNSGYTFTNWTEGVNIVSTLASYPFVITGNRTFVANYTPIPYTVSVTSNPTLGGISTGAGIYNSGSSVTVSATANAGFTFTNWTEGLIVASTNANYGFNILGNRALVANYTQNFTLTITAVNGSVVKNPSQLTYTNGTSVQLTATPNSGYTFTSWSVDATGSVNPLTIIMNSNKAITANFTAIPSTPLFTSAFGAFGGNAGITNQGIFTVINNGSIGTTGASTLVTGFHDRTGDSYTETTLNIGNVTGWVYTAPPPPVIPSVGASGGTATTMAIAQAGLLAASDFYISISPANKPGGTILSTSELGGRTLAPGTYVSGSSYNITTLDLTLDAQGDANAVWIFQVPTALTVGTPSGARSVNLINGALSKNVYWYVGTAAVINYAGGGTMVGTIIANSGVTLSSPGNSTNTIVQTVLNGRAISLVSSVTMVNTIINVPAP